MLYNKLMIKNSSKRTGSAHLIIITIIVLVILGALGFVFWKNINTSTNKSKSSTDKVAQTEQDTTPDYITLSDWGVTFKVSDELKSTQVTYTKNQSADGSSYAFTTKRIHDLGGSCTIQPFGDTQILTRFTEKPVATPDGELLNDPAIDGYYYVLSAPVAPCSIVDKNGALQQSAKVSSTEENDRNALKATLESIQSKDVEVSNGYLTLKDWSVKFKIPEGLTGVKAYKHPFPENSKGFSNSYELTTERVEALGQWCSAITEGNNTVTRLGGISRSSQKQNEYVSAAPANDNNSVGGYYYYVSGGQATCSDEGNDLQLQDLRAINDMLMHPVAE